MGDAITGGICHSIPHRTEKLKAPSGNPVNQVDKRIQIRHPEIRTYTWEGTPGGKEAIQVDKFTLDNLSIFFAKLGIHQHVGKYNQVRHLDI